MCVTKELLRVLVTIIASVVASAALLEQRSNEAGGQGPFDAEAMKGRPPRWLLVCAPEGGQSGERVFFN